MPILTPARRAVVAVATVLALILGVGGIAWAASRTTAKCNPSPEIGRASCRERV